MRDNRITPIVLLSAELASNSASQNEALTRELGKELARRNESYKAVKGRFKGVDEDSYVVVPKNKDGLNSLIRLAEGYSQQCVLYRDETGKAWLCNKDGKNYIGIFKQVPRSIALKEDAYTFDPANNGYYIVEVA